MRIAIPSYRRADILIKQTLKYLEQTDLAGHSIDLFLANREECQEYEKLLKSSGPQSMSINIIQGVRGIPNQRNFIQKHYPEGEHIFMIDDDITTIKGMNRNSVRTQVNNLSEVITEGFKICQAHNTIYWGMVSNTLMLRQSYSHGFIYCVGNVFGLINDKSGAVYVDEGVKYPSRQTFSSGKESHERAILVTKRYGGIIKLMQFGPASAYYKTVGGHQESRNAQGETEISRQLFNRYPGMLRLRRLNGTMDITFINKAKAFPYPLFAK